MQYHDFLRHMFYAINVSLWEEAKGKKGPDQKPPKTKLDSVEKDQVKKALGDAAHSKDGFDVGRRAYTLLQHISPKSPLSENL